MKSSLLFENSSISIVDLAVPVLHQVALPERSQYTKLLCFFHLLSNELDSLRMAGFNTGIMRDCVAGKRTVRGTRFSAVSTSIPISSAPQAALQTDLSTSSRYFLPPSWYIHHLNAPEKFPTTRAHSWEAASRASGILTLMPRAMAS